MPKHISIEETDTGYDTMPTGGTLIWYQVSIIAFWVVIIAFLAWIILFATAPDFVSSNSQIDFGKLLGWSFIFAGIALIIILIIWWAVSRRSN